jgi:RNA polymerase sigma factor (sigma-70 family)
MARRFDSSWPSFLLDKKPLVRYSLSMKEKKLRNLLNAIERGEKVSNETLFFILRACEAKHEGCKNAGYLKLWQRRIAVVKNIIAERNEELVYSRIIRLGRSTDDHEMLSEANYAVVRAIRCFDPKRGIKWATYVVNCIDRALYRVIYGPTQHDAQLDETIPPEFEKEYEEADERCQMVREIIATNSAELSDFEREILALRYAPEPMTFRELGLIYDLSRERIRQIEAVALGKIKTIILKREIEEMIDELVEETALESVA